MKTTGKVGSTSKGTSKENQAAKAIKGKVDKLDNTKQQQPHGPLSKKPDGTPNPTGK